MRIVITDGNLQPVFVIVSRLRVQVRHLRPQVPSAEDLFTQRVTNEPR